MITDLEEETLDLDWFAIDSEGNLAHFTTAGEGFLPHSVKQLPLDELNELLDYFLESVPRRGEAYLDKNYKRAGIAEWNKEEALRDFLDMGKKGLYSYDHKPRGRRPTAYLRLVTPASALDLADLPTEIQDIVARTAMNGKFSEASEISEREIT